MKCINAVHVVKRKGRVYALIDKQQLIFVPFRIYVETKIKSQYYKNHSANIY